jgi:hypothetical protein
VRSIRGRWSKSGSPSHTAWAQERTTTMVTKLMHTATQKNTKMEPALLLGVLSKYLREK